MLGGIQEREIVMKKRRNKQAEVVAAPKKQEKPNRVHSAHPKSYRFDEKTPRRIAYLVDREQERAGADVRITATDILRRLVKMAYLQERKKQKASLAWLDEEA